MEFLIQVFYVTVCADSAMWMVEFEAATFSKSSRILPVSLCHYITFSNSTKWTLGSCSHLLDSWCAVMVYTQQSPQCYFHPSSSVRFATNSIKVDSSQTHEQWDDTSGKSMVTLNGSCARTQWADWNTEGSKKVNWMNPLCDYMHLFYPWVGYR